MFVPIFSTQRHAVHAKKLLCSSASTGSVTEWQRDALVTEFERDFMHCINAKRITSESANDIILMDAGVAARELPSSSGFVVLKVFRALKSKNTQHQKAAYMPSPASSRGDINASGVLRSASAGDVPGGVDLLQLALTPSSAVPAPMTSIITCRLATWSWSMSSSSRGIFIDTQIVQHLREALVVPVNTMRLLGAEEGAMVCFEFHDEQAVKSAESVIFSLMSEGIGEELSLDDYLRHFIAPFFLHSRRAISLGEEFEFKNHSLGDLHVRVVAINDGQNKCGLVTDDTCVRLVVQPESPPTLQGCRGSREMSEGCTPRRRSLSLCRNINAAKESGYLSSISNGDVRVSPRQAALCDMLPRGVPLHIMKDNTTGRERSSCVHEPSPRRAVRGVQPHESTELPVLCPQEVGKNKILFVERVNSATSSRSVNDVTVEEASNPKDFLLYDASIAAVLPSPISSEEHESEEINMMPMPMPNPTQSGMSDQLENSPVIIFKINSASEGMHDSKGSDATVVCFSKMLTETKGDVSLQGDPDSCFPVPKETQEKKARSAVDDSPNEVEGLLQIVTPDAPRLFGDTWTQKEVGLVGASEEVCLQVSCAESGIPIHQKTHNDEMHSALAEKDGKASDGTVCEVQEGEIKTLHQELIEDALRHEREKEPEESREPESFASLIAVCSHDAQREQTTSVISLHQKCDVCTQYELLSDETRSMDAQTGVQSHVKAKEMPISTLPVETTEESSQVAAEGPQQNDGERAKSSNPLSLISGIPTCHTIYKSNAQIPKDVATRGIQIIQKWIAVKKEWMEMPIGTLLKREPHIIIKNFQHFIAVYKELKQRHADCLAYLGSPYGHTMRGGMVLRIPLFTKRNDEVTCDDTVEQVWRKRRSYYTMSNMWNDSEDASDAYESNSEVQSVSTGAGLLKVDVHDISASLGCNVLHVFRVGGTSPALYCTLVKPYTEGPGEIILLGEPCVVDVLTTTIIEDLYEAREESRQEWIELSMKWTEEISTVLRLGVFAKHLQTVRELFWELVLLLGHPGEIRHGRGLWRDISQLHHHKKDSSNNKGGENTQQGVSECVWEERSGGIVTDAHFPPVSLPLDEAVIPFTSFQSFVPYLQELQDTYYLFSELLEPFALHSLHQLNVVSALTDVMQCEQLMEFLHVSYRAQLAERGAAETMVPAISEMAKEERVAFLALVESYKAGAIMPLPHEWWEGQNHHLEQLF